jgi:hypothetical protein
MRTGFARKMVSWFALTVGLVTPLSAVAQSPRASHGLKSERVSIRPWIGGALAFGRLGRRCPTCAYERSPFSGVVMSLGAGVAVAERWRLSVEANQWLEVGLTERADKRSLFATATAAYAPGGDVGASFKLGAGIAHHSEGNPQLSANGGVLHTGVVYRFRQRGFSPAAIVDYFHPLGGRRRASRVDAAGPFEASLLKVGIGVDWRGR